MSSVEGRGWSLRRHLLLRVLLALLGFWVLSAALVIYAARTEVTEDLDDSLSRTATLLLGFAEHEYAETAGSSLDGVAAAEELPRGGLLYQIWAANGRLLLRSAGAPLQPLAPAQLGYQDLQYQGESWRLLTVWNEAHNLRLQLAEPQWHRRAIAGDLSLALLLPLMLAAPVLAILVWLALSRGLAPARDAAAAVAARAPDDFSALADRRLPDELRPLVGAFNALLQRLSRSLENERRVTEDIAHELRTPLAAIRLQAQIAGRAANPAAAQTALDRLLAGVDRATRVIDQLLTLARLDPRHAADLDTENFALARVVEETVHEFEGAARAREQKFDCVVGDELVHSSPQAVYVVLRNLIDNALRHTPPGGRVRLLAAVVDERLCLEVQDQGPGIPAAERDRVLERFVHLQPGSSGLGLFIVRRIALALGGEVEVGDAEPAPGARLRVSWPLSTSTRTGGGR